MQLRKIGLGMGLGVLLMTAGCFRPASDGVVVTPTAPDMMVLDAPADGAVDAQGAPVPDALTGQGSTAAFQMEAASTLPPTLSPDLAAGTTTSTGASSPGDAPPITLIPLGGGAGSIATATPPPVMVTLANITLTPMFITPGAPLAPITLEPGVQIPSVGDVLPAATPSGLITPTSLPGTGDDCLYIVQPGDSLYQISLNEDVTLEEIRAANPDLVGDAPILQIGQQITLPGCGAPPLIAPTPAPTTGSLIGTTGTTTPAGAGEEYVVQSGDTLYDIALNFGVTVQDIINANTETLPDPNRLQVGDRLIIPPGT